MDGSLRFNDIFTRTHKKVHVAMANSNLPFGILLDELKVPRSTAHSPLFQVLMNYRLGALEQDKLGNCELTDMKGTIPGTPYDMTLLATETLAGTSILQFGGQQYLYSNDDTHQLLQAYAHLLNVVSQDPSFKINEYSVFSPEMTNDCLRYAHGDVLLEFASSDTLPAYILQHFKHDFDKIAVKDGYGQILSYGDLRKMVPTLITKLEAAGIRSSTHVALLCEPSADAVCAMLAICHCGATCIPLDLSNQ